MAAAVVGGGRRFGHRSAKRHAGPVAGPARTGGRPDDEDGRFGGGGVAESRLGDEQALGGPGEAGFLGRGQEVPQVMEVSVHNVGPS